MGRPIRIRRRSRVQESVGNLACREHDADEGGGGDAKERALDAPEKRQCDDEDRVEGGHRELPDRKGAKPVSDAKV